VVDAFLTATRAGDFEALLTLLDPDVMLAANGRVVTGGRERVARGALVGAARERHGAEVVLVDGEPGIVVAPRGRLKRVLTFAVRDGRIVRIDVVEDPELLRAFHLAVLDG
jgi:RNA polymerase sigma-70 factor (ECF subfamily)